MHDSQASDSWVEESLGFPWNTDFADMTISEIERVGSNYPVVSRRDVHGYMIAFRDWKFPVENFDQPRIVEVDGVVVVCVKHFIKDDDGHRAAATSVFEEGVVHGPYLRPYQVQDLQICDGRALFTVSRVIHCRPTPGHVVWGSWMSETFDSLNPNGGALSQYNDKPLFWVCCDKTVIIYHGEDQHPASGGGTPNFAPSHEGEPWVVTYRSITNKTKTYEQFRLVGCCDVSMCAEASKSTPVAACEGQNLSILWGDSLYGDFKDAAVGGLDAFVLSMDIEKGQCVIFLRRDYDVSAPKALPEDLVCMSRQEGVALYDASDFGGQLLVIGQTDSEVIWPTPSRSNTPWVVERVKADPGMHYVKYINASGEIIYGPFGFEVDRLQLMEGNPLFVVRPAGKFGSQYVCIAQYQTAWYNTVHKIEHIGLDVVVIATKGDTLVKAVFSLI